MLKKIFAIATIVMLIGLRGGLNLAIAQEKDLGEAILNKIIDDIREWSTTPTVIEALKAANQENTMSMTEILEKDNAWRKSTEVTPFIEQFLTNDLAKYLQKIQADSNGLFAEIEITDLKGVIIAETSKTSDFYQADEDWWKLAYQDGRGGVFRSKPLFDESSHSYNIDLAIPIHDKADGDIIGIVKSGVSILNLQAASK